MSFTDGSKGSLPRFHGSSVCLLVNSVDHSACKKGAEPDAG
jgi:hypothetical protein